MQSCFVWLHLLLSSTTSLSDFATLQQVQERAGRELHVEPPFALASCVSAAARCQSLLVRSSSPDGAPSIGPEATVLPVGEPAVLSATLRVTAPCEVGLHRSDFHWLCCA